METQRRQMALLSNDGTVAIQYTYSPGSGLAGPIEFLFGHGVSMASRVDGFDALAPGSPTHGA